MIFPLQDYWLQLREGTRDQIVGGLILAVLLGLAAIFRKGILRLLRKLVSTAEPLPAPAAPQELVVRFDGLQPAPAIPAAPPVVVPAVPKSYIPRPLIARFIARRDVQGRDIVERLQEELSPTKNQLIVLWGAGGVGKTTLAAETAWAMRETVKGGIVWTSADGKPDFSLSTLLDDIATHLGRPELRQLVPAAKADEVQDALSKAPDTLIVLDNFETISPEQQKECAEWLAKRAPCPALITSRDKVEHAQPVHILAMSLPEAHEFLQRLISEARNPQAFEQLDHEKIIQAADRIPLVLQWIVKQIDSAKQPRVVLEELSQGEGDAAKRVFDHSFNLAQVGDDGRAALLALSLFVPGASRSALANVAGFGADEKRLAQPLQQLTERWLIQTLDGNERVRVEGLTRELAKARLDKDRAAADYKRRFVAYFRQYARDHDKPEPDNYTVLEKEKDNLLNAMDMAVAFADWDSVRDFGWAIALPVSGVLSVRGYWAEALKANQQAFDAARQSGSEYDIASFAHNLAVMHGNRGELKEAEELYNESLRIYRKINSQRGIAITLHQLAMLAGNRGEFTEAQKLYTESLEIKKRIDDQSGIAIALHQLAVLAHLQEKPAEAREFYNGSLEIAKKIHDQSGVAMTLHQLAILTEGQGDIEEARRLYNESLEISRNLGNQSYIASTMHQLAILAHIENQLEGARRLYNESLGIQRKLGDQLGIATTLNMLGRLTRDEGDNKEAARMIEESLVIFNKLNSPKAKIARKDLEELRGKAAEN